MFLSQAYYILTEISKVTDEHSVLVHAGLTAVGKAAIDVCLEKKCQVFVTVSDLKQMQQIKQHFPTVRIINNIDWIQENCINFNVVDPLSLLFLSINLLMLTNLI